MNRTVIPFGVDIEEVKKVFGCKDENLHKALLHSDCFKKFDVEYSFKNELYGILFNFVQEKDRIVKPAKFFGLIKGDDGSNLEGEWNDYGYALLTICCYFGIKFSEDNSEFIYGESWWQINTLMRKNGSSFDLSRMLESKKIFDTPFEYSDIYTNHFDKKEVVEFASQLLEMEKDVDEKNLALFNSLKNGTLICRDKNLDLIIFSFEN
jgi:hypothetical protein